MKSLLPIALLILSAPLLAANKPQVVVNVPPPPAARTTNVTSLAVLSQQIQDLSSAESRRDSVEQMLIESLSQKVSNDGARIDRLEAEAATIETVGGLALTLLLAFAGWSISVSSDRHKENRETSKQIAIAIQSLSTAVAVIESRLGITVEHK